MQPFKNFQPLCTVANCVMKKIILVIAVLVVYAAGNVNAQNREDVIYLKNGNIFRGKVTENITGVKATIEINGRNTFVIPDSAIKLILMNQVIPVEDRVSNASPVEMDASVNFYGGSQNSGGFTFITSYQFPFRLSAGVGVGIEWFECELESGTKDPRRVRRRLPGPVLLTSMRAAF